MDSIGGGGGAHKQRLINVLKKQIEQKENSLKEKNEETNKLNEKVDQPKAKLNEVFFH